MTVAAACAAMGIVTQIFVMTGLAMNIVFFIKTLSGQCRFGGAGAYHGRYHPVWHGSSHYCSLCLGCFIGG